LHDQIHGPKESEGCRTRCVDGWLQAGRAARRGLLQHEARRDHRAVWGPLGLERTEVRKLAAAADGSAPPYQIIWSGYFPSVQALQTVLENPASGEVVGDIPNYYQGAPDIFIGEVLG
jgi:hypothetical protein